MVKSRQKLRKPMKQQNSQQQQVHFKALEEIPAHIGVTEDKKIGVVITYPQTRLIDQFNDGTQAIWDATGLTLCKEGCADEVYQSHHPFTVTDRMKKYMEFLAGHTPV